MKPVLRLLIMLSCLLVAAVATADLICATCGKEIRGDFIEAGNNTYHPHHLECALCGEVLTEDFFIHQGKPVHAACLNQDETATRCAICGGVIWQDHEVDFWGNEYHRSHTRDLDRCPYCTRYLSGAVSKGGYTYQDGRKICGICLESAILESSQADSLKGEVCDHLLELGIELDASGIPVFLIDRQALLAIPGADSTLSGYTLFERYGSGPDSPTATQIFILGGLPRMAFISVLAHELTHAWYYSLGRADLDPALLEGSCNYSSYLVLARYEGEEARYEHASLEANDHPLYGIGFRRVRALAEDEGVAGWLKWTRTESEFPAGF
jgi:hypothetical protein